MAVNGHWRCDSMELVWNGSWNGWNEVWNRIQKWRDPKSDADADAMRGGRWFFYLQSRFGVDALQVVFQRRSPRPRVILVDLILFILDHVSKMGLIRTSMELRDRSATNAKVWPFELMASVLKPCGTVCGHCGTVCGHGSIVDVKVVDKCGT